MNIFTIKVYTLSILMQGNLGLLFGSTPPLSLKHKQVFAERAVVRVMLELWYQQYFARY